MNLQDIDQNVWQNIFLRLPPKYNKVLRRVCKLFYQVTNNRNFLRQQTQLNFPLPQPSEVMTDFDSKLSEFMTQRRQLTDTLNDDVPNDAHTFVNPLGVERLLANPLGVERLFE